MGKGTVITELLDLVVDAKDSYMQGNDVYDEIVKIENFLILYMTENGMFEKMSKSNGEEEI